MHKAFVKILLCVLLFLLALLRGLAALDGSPTAEQLEFFEKKIRPVLAEKCYDCHSANAEKLKGGLLLDSRDGIRRGGENGPAVVPGDIEESLLIQAIRYTDKDFAMPPAKAGGQLAESTIKDFETWIKMGAPDPRDAIAAMVKRDDAAKGKEWWAFQPVGQPAVPEVRDGSWPRGDIDKFLLSALESKGLHPVSDADKPTLLRRIYFDLIGLPPAPQEIDAFLKDTAPDAFEKVVDRLLASPKFGERWGRHWLDVARYAESSGKDVNIAFPHAWRYRDYVIAAFNADKPYDQFVREQIAGDLLPAVDDRQRAEQLTATGFLAIGPKSLNEQNPRQFHLDLADEQIDSMSQALLGLTIACARCHDHKFDPIPQREYYALAGIFLSTETRYGTATSNQNRRPSELIELPPSARASTLPKTLPPEQRQKLEKQLAALQEEQRSLAAERFGGRMRGGGSPAARQRTPANNRRFLIVRTLIGELEMQLKSFDAAGNPKALAMGVHDLPATPPRFGPLGGPFGGPMRDRVRERVGRPFTSIADSAFYVRGEPTKAAEKVPRGFPAILTTTTTPQIPSGSSGRRELAEWLTSPRNPLTARVFVNRVWHWLFGRGLVASVDNFGASGQAPSNPALLDHLATRLVENGWSVKKTIREIVLGHAYQLASTHHPENFTADPENLLVWRMSKRRLDAECIRDAMLAAANSLDLQPPIGSVIAQVGDGPIGGPRRRGANEESLINTAGGMRSVYLPIARNVLPDALDVFDFAETSLVSGARETTNVPVQALYLLNNDFVTIQARRLADRVLAAYPGGPNGGASANLEQRVAHAHWLTIGRLPDALERQAATSFFAKFPADWRRGDKSGSGLKDSDDVHAAWTSYCRALFASAEFRYLN